MAVDTAAGVTDAMPMTARTGRRLVATALWLVPAMLCAQASAAAGTPPAPLFDDERPLQMMLELPLERLLRERRDRPEVDGVVVVADPGGQARRLDATVSTRGHSLNFKRSQVEGTVFAGQNKLKLSTLCRDSDGFEDYLELERLAYLLYQQVSDVSLRVRAVNMRYVDVESGGKVTEAPAFFLEHVDSLAARVGSVVLDVPTVPIASLDPEALALTSLFEYLIGNTDWAATAAAEGRECCHNMVPLIRAGSSYPVVPLPYDFDSSGLVDAPYAVPNPDLHTRSVRERVYRGYCISNPHLGNAREKLNAARPAMEAIISAGRLEPRSRRKAMDYLAEGFEDMNDTRHWQRKIVDSCRG